jgi:hypothetical protein
LNALRHAVAVQRHTRDPRGEGSLEGERR